MHAKAMIAGVAVALTVIVTVLVGAATTQAGAGEKTQPPQPSIKTIPNATRGEAVARRLCVNCHVISNESNATVPEGVPTFHAIANNADQTAARIRGFLIEPHPPMPDIHLSREEIDDIIAYLDTLREPRSGPPLLPNDKKNEKPVYPDAG